MSKVYLIHNNPKTNEIYYNYFYEIINHVMDNGVQIIEQKFINP